MSLSSDEESSDSSSDEYLVRTDKINLESSFFKEATTSKAEKTTFFNNNENNDSRTSDDSDNDDFDGSDEKKIDSAALLVEVMKNLENSQKKELSLVESTENLESTNLKNVTTKRESKNVLSAEIANLLLQGESGVSAFAEDRESEEEESEETKPAEYTIPKEGVNITLPGSAMMMFKRQKKSTNSVEDALRRRMNQKLRSNQVYIHKSGLLCWLAHGFHLNREINDAEVLSTALSLVPSSSYPKGRADLKYLEQFTRWFKNLIKLEFKEINDGVKKETLLVRIKEKKVHNYRELVLLYAATLRAIGLTCRLVVSLCPPALKLSGDQLFQNPKSQKKEEGNDAKSDKTRSSKATKDTSKRGKKGGKMEKTKRQGEDSSLKIVPENSSQVEKTAMIDAKKRAASILAKFANVPMKKSIKTLMEKKDCEKGIAKSPEKKQDEIKSPPRTRRLRSRVIEENSQSKTVKENKTVTFEEDTIKNERKSIKRTRASKLAVPSTSAKADSDSDYEIEKEASVKKKTGKIVKDFETWMDSESDEEFEPKPSAKKRKITTSKKEDKTKSANRDSIDRRVLSSDDEPVEIVDAKGAQNIWVEVYLESEENWISVSVPDDKIHCVSEIYKKAPKPVLYVVAWNSMGTLKDVTRRYCPHWLTVTRKQRVDESWWIETLSPWIEKATVLSRAEDDMLLQRELEQPLPKTVGECKGHPLYALQRHLLKFEALYPPECMPLGHLRTGEAIYSRHCVHTLCSRETWVKKARVVKPAQDPYKIVKAMPKYDKLSGVKLKDQPLELFGKWQTTQYVPPTAKNGIVPRNEYGNVDLFKQCMLPIGTVHINLPALNRVARKLNIDCSPAVVGFNFGARGALPAFEGFVVCEEFEDTLREAWEADQIEATKRAEEKREKRIYGNWKKLIKGLFIRERLAARYDFNNDEDDNDDKKPSASTKRSKQKVTEAKRTNVKKAKSS